MYFSCFNRGGGKERKRREGRCRSKPISGGPLQRMAPVVSVRKRCDPEGFERRRIATKQLDLKAFQREGKQKRCVKLVAAGGEN